MTDAPCPFCACPEIAFSYIRDGMSCGCVSCGAAVVAFNPDAKEKARERWNTRAGVTKAELEWARTLSASASQAEGAIDPDPAPFDKANRVRIDAARSAWKAFDAHIDALKVKAPL